MLKRHGCWKSTAMLDRYIEEGTRWDENASAGLGLQETTLRGQSARFGRPIGWTSDTGAWISAAMLDRYIEDGTRGDDNASAELGL